MGKQKVWWGRPAGRPAGRWLKLVTQANTTLNITAGVALLQKMGFFAYILPFGIIFLLIFAILDKYKIVSEKAEINAALSAFISAFIFLYSYLTGALETFLTYFYGKGAVALMIIFLALLFSVVIYKVLHENAMVPAGKEGLYQGVVFLVSILIVSTGLSAMQGQVAQWAREVTGILLFFGFIAAAAGALAKGGSNQGGG